METKASLLDELNQAVGQLIAICRQLPNLDAAVYAGWTAKDTLGHVTFWHESFARNVSDLAHDRQPAPLKGKLSDLNQQGVEAMRAFSMDEVIGRLEAAQRIIRANIYSPKLISIPYRKGSRAYTPEEHLRLVADHIRAHITAIQGTAPQTRSSHRPGCT